ncbi:MAG: AtpZ/AtpI family protein [Paracoccaceae bacterium]|nr:AtpZ/AtpI family protein [Paracoccaceae bacterium]MDE2913657.1 AtpZ/AtpI family protein [Paracoccaceae bacterium]
MIETPERDPLDELGRRIAAARETREPRPGKPGHATAAQLAWRMVLELVIGLLIGFGIGYGLDRVFDTLPLFLVVFTLFGFAAGIRTMMRTAAEVRDRNAGVTGSPGAASGRNGQEGGGSGG